MFEYKATIKGHFDEDDFNEYLLEVYPQSANITFTVKSKGNGVTIVEFTDDEKPREYNSFHFAQFIAMYEAFNPDLSIKVNVNNGMLVIWYDNGRISTLFNDKVHTKRLWESEKRFFSLTWEKGAQIKHWRSIV